MLTPCIEGAENPKVFSHKLALDCILRIAQSDGEGAEKSALPWHERDSQKLKDWRIQKIYRRQEER